MKTNTLIVIPLAFAAGMLLIVLLQIAGLVRINTQLGTDHQTDQSTSSVSASQANSTGASGSTTVSALTAAPNTSASSTNLVAVTQQIDELRKQVQAATLDRDVLRTQIEQLDDLADSAVAGNEFLPNGHGAEAVSDEALAHSGGVNEGEINRSGGRRGFGEPDGDELYDALVASGIDESMAIEIKQRTDQWSLERLELIDQAAREGWQRSDEFQDRMSELQEARPNVRSEVGDTDYDQYLYESGESNRVQIASIIDGSAAQIAGVESGDLLLSYADQRIYNPRELQQATRGGARGEIVAVTVERAGQLVALELPRGPLGVTLTRLRVEPS